MTPTQTRNRVAETPRFLGLGSVWVGNGRNYTCEMCGRSGQFEHKMGGVGVEPTRVAPADFKFGAPPFLESCGLTATLNYDECGAGCASQNTPFQEVG